MEEYEVRQRSHCTAHHRSLQDFISEGGKIWGRIRGVAEANQCVPHMVQVLEAARRAGIRVFYALHRRYRPGDYESWKYIAPIQKAAWSRKSFEYGTWGGAIRAEFEPHAGDILAAEHWCSSGFANTDLDLQLRKHGIHKLIVIGLLAHTCVEATVRYAAEFGYEVTVVKDATASYSDEHMHAALEVNLPNYASAIVTTDEIVDSISSPNRRNQGGTDSRRSTGGQVNENYDAIVIGTGQAGPALAVRMAGSGQRVAIIERDRFGGTCVNTGCIPTKTLVASAYAAHMARRAFRIRGSTRRAGDSGYAARKGAQGRNLGEVQNRRGGVAPGYAELHCLSWARTIRVIHRGPRG